MGCTISLVRPEHKILDSCIEIVRLACLSDERCSTPTSTSSRETSLFSQEQYISVLPSQNATSVNVERLISLELLSISERANTCKVLPQYVIRELRHAVETVHFKKPDHSEKLKELSESTIAVVKSKTLGLSSQYSCFYSPNDGQLTMEFSPKLQEITTIFTPAEASPSRISLIPPGSPKRSQQQPPPPPPLSPIIRQTTPQDDPCLSPSKTPAPLSPAGTSSRSATPHTSPVMSLKKGPEQQPSVKRASCPPTIMPPRYDFDPQHSNRIRLRSLDENEQDNEQCIDYGFYHEEDHDHFSMTKR